MVRANLTVRTGALASQVVVRGGRAIGVAYLHGRERQVACADHEIVLCGGAVNSPQLLMLSGIGPAAHLRDVGVEVVHDLPGVGENLHDHPAVPLIWHTRDTSDVAEFNNLLNFARAKALGSGPLVSNVGEAGAFFRSRDDLLAPDLQVHFAPSGFWDNGLHEPTTRKLTVAPTLVHVSSRGRMRLRSTDPRWHPEIDPAYYDDQADLDAMVVGARRLIETVHSGPLARYLERPFLPDSPTPRESDLVDHVRRHTQTLYHPVGTCAMGTGEQSVVDPQLRVRGIEGLRVADASVMPMVTRGNTNAPTIMIGEKAADLLRGRDSAATDGQR
jgi:choline dehydrogenase